MKLEAVKSIVLTALILFSILFTISIWNYQPSYDALNAQEYKDPQLNGEVKTKKEIIDPQKIIFHTDNQHLRLQDASTEKAFYSTMQSFSLFDFEPVSEKFQEETGERIELFFPLTLSGRTLSDLFIIEEENIPEEGMFDKISISLENENELSEVIFTDTENNQYFSAHIRKREVDALMNNYQDADQFKEQIVFRGKDDRPIYLPAEEPGLSERYFSINSFSERPELNPLLFVLFNDENVVKQNSIAGGEQFTDGKREIKVYTNYMEFIDPLVKYREMDKWNLISQSLDFINDHHGWTTGEGDEYHLEKVNTNNNTVTYRMYYDGYPVIDEYGHLTTIRLTIHNQLVYNYSRPLIQFRDHFILQEEPVEIGSGERAISLIEQNKELPSEAIENISIGYKLVDLQQTVQIVPGWYYKDNSGWKEIPVPETASHGGGV